MPFFELHQGTTKEDMAKDTVKPDQAYWDKIARAQRLGIHVLKRAPGGARAELAGSPLALPETQEYLARRRAGRSQNNE